MASSQLLWQLVKNNHCFLHKGLHGAQFSSEPGNLYNVNSYKYSGAMHTYAFGDAPRSSSGCTVLGAHSTRKQHRIGFP